MTLSATPSEIQDAFASVGGIHDSFEELIEKVAVKRMLTADNPPIGNYVGVRPALNGTISAYVNAHFVDVSLNPERARSVARTRDWKLLRSNSVTGRVRVPASALADPETFDMVVALIVEAVDKSLDGPPYEGGRAGAGAGAVEQAVEICPKHNEEMLGGTCSQCA
jgi:hypothetical protein